MIFRVHATLGAETSHFLSIFQVLMESAAFGFQFGQGETTIIITSLVETAVFSHYIRFFKIFQGSTQILKKYAEIRREHPIKDPKQNTPSKYPTGPGSETVAVSKIDTYGAVLHWIQRSAFRPKKSETTR